MFGLPQPTSDQALAVAEQIGMQQPALLIGSAMVVFARIMGFMMVVPFFGSMNIPMTVRVGIGAMLTVVITPLIASTTMAGLAQVNEAGGGIAMLLLLVNQVLIGLMLGLVAAFVFFGIESAGRLIDTQRGTNMADMMAPTTGERSSPMGQFLMLLALLILLVTNQHKLLLSGILESFNVFPPTMSLDWIGRPGGNTELIQRFADISGESLLITVKIAAPAMLSLMLADVLLGIINRGAPQVNVFVLSMIIKAPLGIAAVLVALIPIVEYLKTYAFHDLLNPQNGWLFEFSRLMNP